MGVDVCGKDPQLGSRGKRSIAGLVFEGNKCQWHKRTASSCSTVWKDFIGVPGRLGAVLTDRIRNSDADVSETYLGSSQMARIGNRTELLCCLGTQVANDYHGSHPTRLVDL